MNDSGSEDFLHIVILLGDRPKKDPAAKAVLSMLSEMDSQDRFSRKEALKALDQMIGATHQVESELAFYARFGKAAADLEENNRPLWFVINTFSRKITSPQYNYLTDLMARIRAVANEIKAFLIERA